MTKTQFDLLEAGKAVGWNVEPTEVVLMGETCPCGCRYMATRRGEDLHFRTANAAREARCFADTARVAREFVDRANAPMGNYQTWRTA
jgi:hypothetical protein